MNKLLFLAIVLFSLGSVLNCGGRGPAHRTPTATGVLQLNVSPMDAQLYINEEFIAPVKMVKKGIRLKEGVARVQLRLEGFYAHYQEVMITPSGVFVLETNLVEKVMK